jgi:hypothetical protein
MWRDGDIIIEAQHIFLAVNRIDPLHDFPGLSDDVKCADQQLSILRDEAERLEKLRLAAIVWTCGVQEVLEHLVSLEAFLRPGWKRSDVVRSRRP